MTLAYDTVKLLDLEFINTTKDMFLSNIIYPSLERQDKCFIVTANPEFVIAAREKPEFRETLKDADYVLPDGIGIVNASKMIGKPLQERVTGIDVMEDMLGHAAEHGYRVFFLGASEKSNSKAVENIKEEFPDLIVAGRRNGFFNRWDPDVTQQVLDSKPDIVFVALGMQRQEDWIDYNIGKFDKGIFIGVGGSFDVWSGTVDRAPETWIKFQLEWLYRLIQQPRRIRRVMKAAKFLMLHVPVLGSIMRRLGFARSRPRQTRDEIE